MEPIQPSLGQPSRISVTLAASHSHSHQSLTSVHHPQDMDEQTPGALEKSLTAGKAAVHCAPLHLWLPWMFFQWSSGLGSVGLRGTASSLAADVTQRWSGGAGGFYSLKKHLPLLLLTHGAQVNPQRITKTVTKKQASAISDKGNRQQQERDRRINCRDVSWEKKSIRMSYRRTMLYLKP